jgi:hypothetical protein
MLPSHAFSSTCQSPFAEACLSSAKSAQFTEKLVALGLYQSASPVPTILFHSSVRSAFAGWKQCPQLDRLRLHSGGGRRSLEAVALVEHAVF